MARILVAEEDLLYRELVQFMLERAGHQVVAVEGARQCLRRLETDPAFELIVVNLCQRHAYGGEVVAAIRRRAGPVPIVSMVERELEPGPARPLNAVLAKPFSAVDLSRVVDAALARGT